MRQASSVARWTRQLDAVHARLAPLFVRPEPRARARAYLRTVLAGAERRNGWQLAEAAGEATPYGMQRLIASATWDANAVRDDPPIGAIPNAMTTAVRPQRGAGALLVAVALAAQTAVMGRAVAGLDVAVLVSYALWAARPTPTAPRHVLPWLGAALLVQAAHLAEEYRAGFQRAFPALFGYAWSDARFLGFNAAWLAAFAVSALAVVRGRRLGYLGATFLAVGGGIGNGLGHLALAVRAGGYFPGAYTAPLALGAGVVLLARLLRAAPQANRADA